MRARRLRQARGAAPPASRNAMGHRFHSGVSAPTIEILDPGAAAPLINPDATATLVADGFGTYDQPL